MTPRWRGWACPPERGEMPGMASEEDLERLRNAVRRRGRRVLRRADGAHHLGGIHMAEYAAGNAESEAVRSMAASIGAQPSGRDRRDGARARQLTALPAVGRPDRSTDRSYTPIDAGRVENVPPRPGRGARTHARLHVRRVLTVRVSARSPPSSRQSPRRARSTTRRRTRPSPPNRRRPPRHRRPMRLRPRSHRRCLRSPSRNCSSTSRSTRSSTSTATGRRAATTPSSPPP